MNLPLHQLSSSVLLSVLQSQPLMFPCRSVRLTVSQLYQPVSKTHWPARLKLRCRPLELRRQPCRLSRGTHTNWRRLWKQRYWTKCDWRQGCGAVTVMLVQNVIRFMWIGVFFGSEPVGGHCTELGLQMLYYILIKAGTTHLHHY